MTDAVVRTDEDGIVLLQLSRPPLNLITADVRDALAGHIADVARDESVACVVLYGGIAAFSAGADIRELRHLNGRAAVAWNNLLQSTFARVAELGVPVIAAVGRLALGGGLELALCADFRVVAADALMGQPEIHLGILPGSGGTQRLARLVGITRAKDLLMTGRRFDAAEAERIGLADELAAADQVLERAMARARVLAGLPGDALNAIKSAIDHGTGAPLQTGLALERALFAYQFGSAERERRFDAFLNRKADDRNRT